MNWDKFCKIGHPAWHKYAMQQSKTVFREETEFHREPHGDSLDRSVHIRRTFCDVPVRASVLARFEKDDAGQFTKQLMPLDHPILKWGLHASLYIQKVSYGTLIGADGFFEESTVLDETFTGCDGLTARNFAEAEWIGNTRKMKVLSESKDLEKRLRENPYFTKAIEAIDGRYGFTMFPIGPQRIGRTECINYYLSVTPDECNVNADRMGPPPITVEALSAIFSVYKELITELVLLGALYRAPE